MKNSIRTRLTLATAAIVAVFVATALGVAYWVAAATLERDAKEGIRQELQSLVARWNTSGIDGLIAEVERRSTGEHRTGFAYLVAQEEQLRVAGNVRRWPPGQPGSGTGERVPVDLRDADVWLLKRIHLESVQLDDHQLLVGRDTSRHDALLAIVGKSALAGSGLAALLAVGAGLAVSRGLLGRVETMRVKISRILNGDRAERVATGGSDDEFDELATQFNRLLDENERLLSQVREATNNIAHDLRTPLQRMHSRLESALSSTPASKERDLLEALSADTDRLLEMFNGLLQIARVEAEEIRKSMQPAAVGPLVDDIVDLYEPLAEEVGLSIKIEVQPDLSVLAERQLLGQAVANLVDNAIKYAPNGDTITIGAKRKGDRVVLSVGDHGPGIPNADRHRVLERLVRLDSSRTVPGSGLGLSFVAAVARLHGSDLELHDNKPGLRIDLSLLAAS